MPRFAPVIVLLAVMAAAAYAQFDYFGGFPGGLAAPRDPRENRGPVTFPVTQPGSETSGVRVGASGYGFLPPGQRGGGGKTRRMDTEEEWMAAFQLAKMTERQRMERLVRQGELAAESRGREARAMAAAGHQGLKHRLQQSIARAEELAQVAMKAAERRVLALIEKWTYGKFYI